MQKRLLESRPCAGLKNGTHLDVEVYYTKGGVSHLAGNSTPRGYYLRVTPVTRTNTMVSMTLFTGLKKLLMSANRYSASQFEKAVAMGQEVAPELIKRVIEMEKAA